ncbi:rhomboid family intramembrane serine protease [Luteolibacter flavescens]|uniref:Rhomboid family intramembrane serine protease n=1 Tax=Luteolibacter flavescens TaxID=1859460 RepID=A0ABT3FPW8_9BACT|nr:rhomboid family intramembrane serine protease [Luteolibacter flavescens]MCW1885276.1 rhomboid family intramembrane serine protease [Luteolibacter flavescens]
MRNDAVRELFREQGALLGLIVVMFGIFFFQEVQGWEWYFPFMAIPAEISGSWQNLREGTAGIADYKAFGTLITYAFLHADPEHIVYNMLFLWVFAALAVELLGVRWMFGIFVFTAVSGGIFDVVLNANSPVPMLGASGALMGFEGAYLGLATRWALPEPHIWPMARPVSPGQLALIGVLGVAIDYTSLMSHAPGNVAYGAHIGGFVGGLVLTALAAPRPRGATAHQR